MPEQAEWTDGSSTARPADTMPITAHVDGDDYTYPPIKDCRTYMERTDDEIAALRTTVAMLIDEVQHLREDIARMRTGESQI